MIRRFLPLIVMILLCSLVLPAAAQDQNHVVQYGESLFRIAQQYGVSVEAIARVNNIANTWRIDIGQILTIPSADAAPLAEPDSAIALEATATDATTESVPVEIADASAVEPSSTPEQTHVVAWGESLGSIASRHQMSLEALARLNNILNPDLIYSGQVLIIQPGTGTQESAPRQGSTYSSVTHIVQPGESLVTIAREYEISWLQIAQWNNLTDADLVMPGIELIIPGADVLPDANHSFATAPAAPEARIGTGREIIIDLSEQRIYAYEDGRLVRSVIVSTGLPATPTVQGNFTAQRKYVAQTMTGPGYYLPDVPYVVYFYAGYALHGTYWHDNFGQPMSHGCVNLPTPEAEWFYTFADIGTPIHVQT